MGVYIKGMEMPKDCLKCPFCLFADGYWKCLVDGSHADFGGTCRPSLCPLVPIPEHGRLIDADALSAKLNMMLSMAFGEGNTAYYFAYRSLGKVVENAPTIIEAEEGE